MKKKMMMKAYLNMHLTVNKM